MIWPFDESSLIKTIQTALKDSVLGLYCNSNTHKKEIPYVKLYIQRNMKKIIPLKSKNM